MENILDSVRPAEWLKGYDDGLNGRPFRPPSPEAKSPSIARASNTTGSGSRAGGGSSDEDSFVIAGLVFAALVAVAAPFVYLFLLGRALGIIPLIVFIISSVVLYCKYWKRLWSGTRKAVVTMYFGVGFPLAMLGATAREGSSTLNDIRDPMIVCAGFACLIAYLFYKSPHSTPPPTKQSADQTPAIPTAPTTRQERVASCPSCGSSERIDAFCARCGCNLPRSVICQSCHAEWPVANRYCSKCGAAL